MQDSFLQEMTASVPLSLEEEYAMQASWRDDEKKCTFILLDKANPSSLPPSFSTSSMVGDVNLFFNDQDNDLSIAEIEIMIAEPRARGKGMGKEGVGMMMRYAVDKLGVKRFYCKISEDNLTSLRMFEGLGYVRVAYVAAFKEIELEFLIKDNDGWPEKFAALKETAGGAKIQEMVQYEEMEEGEEGKGIG
ncbi:n-acetyltransferase 9 [Nannochloropsis oceanica]